MYIRINSFLLFTCVLALSILVPTSWAKPKLRYAAVLFRHGDRTPTAECLNPKNYHNWPIGLGELTPLGINQEYEHGKLYRKRYVQKFNLIPEKYDYKSLNVLSTDVNRTLMSASAVLYGLYPPGTGPDLADGQPAVEYRYQPVPIHSQKRENDMLLSQSKANEDLINKIRKSTVEKSEDWIEKEKSLKDKFTKWSQIYGKPITSLNSVKKFASIIFIRRIHHVPIPKGITQAEVEELSDLAGWIHAQQFKPQKIGILVSGNLLKKICRDFTVNAKSSKTDIKLNLYSAHDTNILGIMSALGVPLEKNPHYASYVMFELYENNSVNIEYNGRKLQLPLNKTEDGFYALSEFVNYVNSVTELNGK